MRSRMSPKGFEAALRALSGLLKAAGDQAAYADIQRLASVFAHSPEKTTGATLKKISGLQSGGAGLSNLSAVLRETKTFATHISAAKFAKLLDELIVVLEHNPSPSVAAFVDA